MPARGQQAAIRAQATHPAYGYIAAHVWPEASWFKNVHWFVNLVPRQGSCSLHQRAAMQQCCRCHRDAHSHVTREHRQHCLGASQKQVQVVAACHRSRCEHMRAIKSLNVPRNSLGLCQPFTRRPKRTQHAACAATRIMLIRQRHRRSMSFSAACCRCRRHAREASGMCPRSGTHTHPAL